MADAADEEPEKPMDPEEARKARGKEGKRPVPLLEHPTDAIQVLFLRHRLQKGFLSRDSVPQEEDMPQMSNYIKKLENYEELEVSIIRETKINKVLKALVKLNSIPRDEEFNFRKRSIELLGKWNKVLGAESMEAEPATEKDKSTPTTNGVHDESTDAKKDEPEPPAENQAETADAVEKVLETNADQSAKATVVEEIQDEEPDQPSGPPAVETEKASEPAVSEKAPESGEGAAEVREALKVAE